MRTTLLILIGMVAAGCGSTGASTDNTPAPAASEPMRTKQMRSSTVEHTSEPKPGETPVRSTSARWTQSGDPIDTTEFDSAIASAEKTLKAKPSDESAKKAAADAYFRRGFALTEARQYASALGDYRKALKLVPTHEEAKKWEQQIIGIYEMMKKDYPKPGEEPPPLPFKES